MPDNDVTQITTSQASASRPVRERVGLAIEGSDAARAVQTIVAAEAAGVRQIWMTQGGVTPDTLITFTAAAMKTTTIRLGTAIIPAYPRHPLFLAQQALAINDIAPGRLRLGVGTSHRPVIEGTYGIKMTKPLAYLREYVTILRAALWEGKVDHHGNFFDVNATLARPPHVPILISTLRENAFRLAGEISDGALPWLCPVPYLLNTGLPALRAAADSSGRSAPPLIAHVLVALHQDRQAALEAARNRLRTYATLPFYASMFADAGFPVAADGSISDSLVDSLVVSGDETTVAARFNELLNSGLDELLVLPIPVTDADSELTQLTHVIGQL
jgi:F420-dependent oxidoreductase-like protein